MLSFFIVLGTRILLFFFGLIAIKTRLFCDEYLDDWMIAPPPPASQKRVDCSLMILKSGIYSWARIRPAEAVYIFVSSL